MKVPVGYKGGYFKKPKTPAARFLSPERATDYKVILGNENICCKNENICCIGSGFTELVMGNW